MNSSLISFHLSAYDVKVTYEHSGGFSMSIGGATYSVTGELEDAGNETRLMSTINGVKRHASVVQSSGTLHVFSTVSHTAFVCRLLP